MGLAGAGSEPCAVHDEQVPNVMGLPELVQHGFLGVGPHPRYADFVNATSSGSRWMDFESDATIAQCSDVVMAHQDGLGHSPPRAWAATKETAGFLPDH